MLKKEIYFIDMDGTVADFFSDKACLSKMMTKGYFRKLPKFAFADKVNELATIKDVYILSACVGTNFCKEEKINWVHEHIPNIPDNKIILCEIGTNKAELVKEIFGLKKLTKRHLLVDDYTKNLVEWELAGGQGIKKLNGMNNTSKQWKGVVWK